ncbi:MAG: HAD family hydrolase [Patescibacteria group bacterium]|jgi:FMN phosphatase YigB (HAD superfamily)
MNDWQVVENLNDIPLNDVQGVVADIDYTLVDFAPAHKAGIQALAKMFNPQLAVKVDKLFHLILEGHRKPKHEVWAEREEFDQLMEQMKKIETVDKEHDFKVWSREAWLIIAAREQGLRLTTNSLALARDAYWQTVRKDSKLYLDAKEFTSALSNQNIPLVLMTGSDSVLSLQETTGKLVYDPIFSETYKRQSLKQLPIRYSGLVIGDPADKPHPKFFDKLENELAKLKINLKNTIFIGDSPLNDLTVPSERGYKTYYINRNK